MTNERRLRRATLLTSAGVVICLAVVGSYLVGHRAGRGAACFQVAVNTPNQKGESLTSLLLSRPEVASDYTFWGTHCTISIALGSGEAAQGGRWAYFPGQAKLFAADAEADTLFPAAGRWP